MTTSRSLASAIGLLLCARLNVSAQPVPPFPLAPMAQSQTSGEAPRLPSLPPAAPAPADRAEKTEPVPAGDRALADKAEARRLAESERHAAQAQRLLARHQPGAAAFQRALSYIMDSRTTRLLEVAAACHHADLDLEALAIYQRLQQEPLAESIRTDVNEAVSSLLAKLEDSEIAVPRTLRAHLDASRQRFAEGRFLQAADEYALAYSMKPLPRLLFNMAQAYRRAGKTDEAYILYSRFVREERQTPLRKEADSYVEELRTLAFRPPVYRRAWFWGVVGTAAAAVVAGSVGLAVGLRRGYPQTDAPPQSLTFGLTY